MQEQGTSHGTAAGARYHSKWSCGDSHASSEGVWIRMKLYQNLLGGGQTCAKVLDCMSPLDYGSKDADTQDQTGHKTGESATRLGMCGKLGSVKEAFCTGKLCCCSTDFLLTCFGNVV